VIGSKKDDAADVAQAASQIRVLLYISDDPREGYDVKRTVSVVSLLRAHTNLEVVSITRIIMMDVNFEELTLCTAASRIR